ncbi:hypothetical protein CASFOL_020374 [Castilleja foliolosa]|uniref:GRAM domain-containing protein n=1 Tax=Castilleja foliolosa TaxID=1961234 RepID=A0ABD3D257_9LAMI
MGITTLACVGTISPVKKNGARGELPNEPVNKEVNFDEDDEGYEGNYEEEADDEEELKAFKARWTNQRFNTLESENRTNQVEARARHESYLRIIGIPISSAEYEFFYKSFSKALLTDSAASQYQLMPPHFKHYSKIKHRGVANSVITKMIKIRDHVKLGQKLTETVKGKLSLGVKILQVGGVDKVFERKFNIRDNNEKLLKASQCYLSITAGPIAGLLIISNNRIAFCSERSIKVTSPSGKLLKVQYKVMIQLRKINRAVEIENAKKTTQKYVKLVTEDNFDFWFMGFLNHQRTLKYLKQAIYQADESFDI